MAEYIEREAIQKRLNRIVEVNNLRTDLAWFTPYGVNALIEEIPAADVRPVVTCGKCKYGKYTGTEWFCDKHSGHAHKFGEDASYHEYHSKHWFCADGEKREES